MARRSPRKKVNSPITVVDSDNEDFVAVASDDQPESDVDDIGLQCTDDNETESHQDSNQGKRNTKLAHKRSVYVKNNRAPTPEDEDFTETPPPTPSPVKGTSGKKRALASHESDDDDVFVPSPTRDSPKKARAKEPTTPSKILKSARQLAFDAAVDKAKAPASKLPDKAVSPDSTVYLADVEMHRVLVPELDRCQIYNASLVDPQLKQTYRKIPRLPRMADYAPAWGPRCDDGGFQFSEVLSLYKSPDVEYLKRLVAFDHDRAGNVANLSRIDPSLLSIKDANSFIKNALYLHGISSAPVLCFSLVLITRDNHEHGRTFGSEPKEWVMKDVAGVMLTMELERFIAVLGLAYGLPYVPDDGARREQDLLHLSMVNNAFSFTTGMMIKSEYDNATGKAGSSSNLKSTPKRINKHKFFAPASPAYSSNAATVSSAARKPSLRASETVPFYDGRKIQLKVPDQMGKIPDLLPRYTGTIPEYTLALVGYTVSTYSSTSGPRKDQVTANLHIQFGVVLQEPFIESADEVSGDEEKDDTTNE